MRVFLDAGHNYSGWDTGAQSKDGTLREQDVTFNLAVKARDVLTANGVETALSRNNITDNLGNDVNSSLETRVAMSDSFGADLCVSIHCNAGGGTGTETYICARGGEAEKAAKAVNNKLVAVGLKDRGVKVASFYMVTQPKAPAILIETAFIDNDNDVEILRNKQDVLARAIAEGILEYANIPITDGGGEMIYNYIDDNMPEWARPTIQKLCDKGYLKGNENGELGLTFVELRIYTVLDRAGAFDIN